MADTFVYSTDVGQTQMIPLPWYMQNPDTTAGNEFKYSANAVRYLLRGMRATAPYGVGSGTDFVTTIGTGRTVNVSGGVAVIQSTTKIQERYIVGALGSTTAIPLPGIVSGTNHHLLEIKVYDKQLGDATSNWAFHVKQGTGGVLPAVSNNAIAIADILDLGTGSVDVTNLTSLPLDIRSPFDNTAPTCAITRTTSQNNTGTSRQLLTFTAQEDDPYNMWTPSAADRITIRHTGTYNIWLSALWPNITTTADYVEAGVCVNGISGTPIAQNKAIGVQFGTVATAFVLNQHLVAGNYLQCYGLNGGTGTQLVQAYRFRLQRVEWRAS